nr:hypothetical protein CFP56_52790 [Quercus suber]
MLRLAATRIDLTGDDIDGFETRSAARRSGRQQSANDCFRLTAGPGRLTSHAVTAENQIVDYHRVNSGNNAESNEELIRTLNVVAHEGDQQDVSSARATSGAIEQDGQQRASDQLSPRVLLDDRQARPNGHTLSSSGSQIGGTIECPDRISSAGLDDSTSTLPGKTILALREIGGDAYPVEPSPRSSRLPSSPRPFSSARARRHQIFNDPIQQQELIEHRHRERIPPYQSSSILPSIQQPVPHLVLSLQDESNAGLDPGAPVFVPRTRFASSVTYDRGEFTHAEPQWSIRDSTQRSSNLRTRPISEQNVEGRSRGYTTFFNILPEPQHSRRRLRTRTSDQRSGLPRPTSGTDRYAGRRPNARIPTSQREAPDHPPAATPMFSSSQELPQDLPPNMRSDQFQFHVRHIVSEQRPHPLNEGRATLDDASSIAAKATRNRTRFIPNVDSTTHPSPHRPKLDPFSPEESLTAPNADVPTSSNRYDMKDSVDKTFPYQSPTADSLHMSSYRRDHSPLDQLTEDLSRLSASLGRPRSVGRWFDNRPRTSLLHGNPFHEHSRPSSPRSTVVLDVVAPDESSDAQTSLSGPLPTQSSKHSSSSALPSPPIISHRDWCPDSPNPLSSSPSGPASASNVSPDTEHGQTSSGPPESHHTRSDVPCTPRVRVYNDTEPPHTQPQTSADLAHSRRRLRANSHPSVPAPPSVHSAVRPVPPSALARNAGDITPFSASTPARVATLTSAIAPTVPSATPATAPRIVSTHHRRRHNERRQDIENDVEGFEGHLAELREERRVWLSRRRADAEGEADGRGLEITPPGQGRFERMLWGGS